MKTSEKFTTILTSILNIQEKMVVEPDGENRHLKAKYATLDKILKTIKPILKEEGLIILQDTESEDRSITCTTRVCHAESGEWFESSSTVPIEKTSAQGVGSSTTYGRRYSLCTALGIGMNNDDDGNAAETALTKAEAKKEEADRLLKYKGTALNRLMKYPVEVIEAEFNNIGCVAGDFETAEETVRDLIMQSNSISQLTAVGLAVKTASEKIEKDKSSKGDDK